MNLTQSGGLCVVSTSNIQCVTKQSVAIVAAAFFDPKLFTETFKDNFLYTREDSFFGLCLIDFQ